MSTTTYIINPFPAIHDHCLLLPLLLLYFEDLQGTKIHSSTLNYEWKRGWVLWEELLVLSGWVLKSESESIIFWTGWVLTIKSFCQCMGCRYVTDWVNIILALIWRTLSVTLHIAPLCCLLYTLYRTSIHVFAGRVKIVSHWSCRTSAILNYFCPLTYIANNMDPDQIDP